MLSQSIGVTRADIRYQLKKLIIEDNIRKVDTLYQDGRGRPAVLYGMQESIPAEFYAVIVASLLDTIKITGVNQKGQLEKVAVLITRKLLGTGQYSGSPAVRLSQKINHLALYGFEIHWVAGPKGPILKIVKEPVTYALQNEFLAQKTLEFLIENLNEKSPT